MKDFLNFIRIFLYNNLCFFLLLYLIGAIPVIEEKIHNNDVVFFFLYLISYQLIFSLITYFIYF